MSSFKLSFLIFFFSSFSFFWQFCIEWTVKEYKEDKIQEYNNITIKVLLHAMYSVHYIQMGQNVVHDTQVKTNQIDGRARTRTH